MRILPLIAAVVLAAGALVPVTPAQARAACSDPYLRSGTPRGGSVGQRARFDGSAKTVTKNGVKYVRVVGLLCDRDDAVDGDTDRAAVLKIIYEPGRTVTFPARTVSEIRFTVPTPKRNLRRLVLRLCTGAINCKEKRIV